MSKEEVDAHKKQRLCSEQMSYQSRDKIYDVARTQCVEIAKDTRVFPAEICPATQQGMEITIIERLHEPTVECMIFRTTT